MYKLLSQRLKPIHYPDKYEYHKTSQVFINQSIRIISDMLSDDWLYSFNNSIHVSDAVCKDFFLQVGEKPDGIDVYYDNEDLIELLAANKDDVFLDLLDLVYQVMFNKIFRTPNAYYDKYASLQNEIFKRNGIGYQVINGCLIPISEEIIHNEIIVPSFRILIDLGFKDASDYLVNAYDRFHDCDNEAAVIEATNALESVINEIIHKASIQVNGSKMSHKIEALVEANILPSYEKTTFNSLIQLLNTSHIVRNNTFAHDNENQSVPNELFLYVINSAASSILFLVSSFAKTGRS